MPQIFRIGQYIVYFWSNEGRPLEPLHVHIANGKPGANATKVWITEAGKCLLCNNNSQIPFQELRNLMRIIEANCDIVIEKWLSTFGSLNYYC